MSNLRRIVFTGGGEGLGAELVQRLQEVGHSVFTFGLGCTYPLDFRFLSPIKAAEAIGKASATFGAPPNVLIHNARMIGCDLSHALYCNINARVLLNRAFLKANEGDPSALRVIDMGGHTPEWAITADAPMISQAGQAALCKALADLPSRALLEKTKVFAERLGAAQGWAKNHNARVISENFKIRVVDKDTEEDVPLDLDPTQARPIWIPRLDVVRLTFDLLGTTIGKFESDFVNGKLSEAMSIATMDNFAEVVVG